MSIYKKLLILFLSFSLLPMLFIGIWSFYTARESLEKEILRKLEGVADLKARNIEAYFNERKGDVQTVQISIIIKENLPILNRLISDRTNPDYIKAKASMDKFLKTYVEAYGYFEAMLMNPEGKVIYNSNEAHSKVELGKPLFGQLRGAFEKGREGIFLSEVYRDEIKPGQFLMLVTAPIPDSEGRFIGEAAFEMSMNIIYVLIQDRTGLGETGETLIGKKTADGAIFLNPLRYDPEATLKREVKRGGKKGVPILNALYESKGSGFFIDYRGEEVIAAWRYIPSLDWGMVAKIDVKEAFEPVTKLKNRVTILLIASLCIGAIIVILITRTITRPIIALTHTAKRINEGDLSVRTKIKGADELAQLSETFDKMAGRIQSDTESLHNQIKQLSIIFDSFDGVVYVSDLDTKESIFINKYGKEIDWEKAYWEAGKGSICSKESLIKDGVLQSPYIYELEYAAAERWFQCIDRAIEWLNGRTVKLQIALDITVRKWIEEELRKLYTAVEQSEKKLRDITSALGEGVFELDREGCLTFMNPEAEHLLGWREAELIGKYIHDLIHRQKADGTPYPEEECPVLKVISSGKTHRIEDDVFTRKDGTVFPVSYISTPLIQDEKVTASVTAFRDITARKNMEEALMRAKNLESLGFVAMGIAHDFNNLLTAILGNISLSKEYIKPEDEIFDMLSKSEDACMKAKDLTGRLLTFSLGGASVKKIISIGIFLRESVDLALRGSNIRCEFSPPPDDLYAIEADERQMNQVIQNIVINAREAMTNGGVITISAENTMVSKMVNLPLKEGNYIKITIKDQGVGIPKEYLDKIFDPYFSTKQKGVQKGMGLGLSLCYSIIKKHNGYIFAESTVGAGTTFHIYLPALQIPLTPPLTKGDFNFPPFKKGETKNFPPLIKGGEGGFKGRILVMDDEEVVRDVAGKMLKHIGYEAGFAGDGTEAIEIYKKAMESGHPFDAVIMDLTIPGGMGGKEAIKKLKEIDPGVKAIVSSGYADDEVMAEFREYGFMGAAAKPYKIKDMRDTLQKVIRTKN